jgi:cytochrome c peroxidase
VPTLRNVALTAPYFHNGAVPTLDEAVRVMAKTQLDKELTDEQAADLVAFLNGLTGEFPEIAMPRLPGTPNMSVIPPIDPHLAENPHQ